MRLRAHTRYPIALALGYVGAVAAWLTVPRLGSPEFLLSAIGGVSALGFFLYSRHLEQAKFFKELFVAFNTRYDALNEELARINAAPAVDGEAKLVDYFNLCAEEHFFHEAGYIDEEVWQSWCEGMKQYAQNPLIRVTWQRELETGSYYGFKIPE